MQGDLTRLVWAGVGVAMMSGRCWGGEPPAPDVTAREVWGGMNWPEATRECRPWSYWWWLGSAVDATNLTRELERYAGAGWGGVHIIPIYGAQGWEERYLEYLSPAWLAMLRHTGMEAGRLGLGMDMTLGTGWCFGGPGVTEREANARVNCKVLTVGAGEGLAERFDRAQVQALVAFSATGEWVDLTDQIGEVGEVEWQAAGEGWRVYAVTQRPSGRKVKRAAPGGEGHMLNLVYPEAMRSYLEGFTRALAGYEGPKPRAVYHDSYEYVSDWSPDFFAQFRQRRGYRLQAELPALFRGEGGERVARVKCDYRETVSDVMVEATLPLWVDWARGQGMRTRNQAHGSPGNWLDLYGVADIPETEMFHKDRSILVSKFASSAAHVTGKRLVAAETGTWLREHFTETLADVKYLVDDLWLAGVNHVVFHGTCYSPEEAGWPGWLFYASTQMNPRNPIWRDVPVLAGYISRGQSVLQAGEPDNDILVYWPIHDWWQRSEGMVQNLTVHSRGWLEGQPIGRAARFLWERGYAFDYVSDRQLGLASVAGGAVVVPGGEYRVVVVPECRLLPVATLRRLLGLAEAGATVIFGNGLPADVPGWGNLEMRREKFAGMLAGLDFAGAEVKQAVVGSGRVLVGTLGEALAAAAVRRERLADVPGLFGVRRRVEGRRHYFVANRGEGAVDGWVPLAVAGAGAVLMDPLTGRTGLGKVRPGGAEGGETCEVYLQLAAGESLIVRLLDRPVAGGRSWAYWEAAGAPWEIAGEWRIEFLEGGPVLPPPAVVSPLRSWAGLGVEGAEAFSGTARYTTVFDAPAGDEAERDDGWWLDLGQVCQSARVRLNGRDLGTVLAPPFRVAASGLQASGNRLEVEVTSVGANRIRDLDRRGVKWRTFRDINFVNIDYKAFDASGWPVTDGGLLGPVRLVARRERGTE